MRTWKEDIVLLLVLLTGVSILLYPAVSNRLNAANQTKVVAEYRNAVENGPDDRLKAVRDSADDYNRALYRAFGGKFGLTSEELDERYWTELDPENSGVMGYLRIPAIGATIPIEHGISDATLQNAAGHLECSSLPVGGSGTHTILSGHRGLPSSVLFTNLDQVKAGDRIYLYVLGDTLAYEVDRTEVVLPTETGSLNIVPGEDMITLVTCTPYGINTQRILVHGRRVPYVPTQEKKDDAGADRVSWISMVNLALLAAGFAAALLIVILVPRHYRKKREERRS